MGIQMNVGRDRSGVLLEIDFQFVEQKSNLSRNDILIKI